MFVNLKIYTKTKLGKLLDHVIDLPPSLTFSTMTKEDGKDGKDSYLGNTSKLF